MPRRTWPPPPLPKRVTSAVTAFGNESHVALLIFLGSVPGATTAEILENVPIPIMTLHRLLNRLELLGLVTADIPAGQRQGRVVRWSLLREPCRTLLDDLGGAILGNAPDQADGS